MVTGGMAALLQGEKTYYSYVPDYQEWLDNVGGIKQTSGNWELYAKAREIGLDHKEAGILAIYNNPSKYYYLVVRKVEQEGKI
jgi:hypothetical protein